MCDEHGADIVMDSSPDLRRTRFVCVSDTHNASPSNGSFKLPKGDVLIHAGDLTNQGSISELRKTIEWIKKADFEIKIVVAGNHDISLDTDFYAQYGSYFHNQNPQSSSDCIGMLKASSILYLNHEAATVRLTNPNGPKTTFKVFGSPYSPAKGLWAFGYAPEEASHLWNLVPLDTNVVVTHTPPKYHCDESADRGAAGCEILRQILWRVRPQLVVCGHVHQGRGYERVKWDLNSPNIKYKEEGVSYGNLTDELNKKHPLVDLTTNSGSVLDNDGLVNDSVTTELKVVDPELSRPMVNVSREVSSHSSSSDISLPRKFPSLRDHTQCAETPFPYHDMAPKPVPAVPASSLVFPATRGQGGLPPSGRCDLEALTGRLGRKETCVINASIMATSWPHKGGKKYNKPMVVDIALPTWEVASLEGLAS